jgi:hypothetical protein
MASVVKVRFYSSIKTEIEKIRNDDRTRVPEKVVKYTKMLE